jgi:ferric iron reductase protein FhuF
VIKFGDEVIVIKFGDEVMSGITTLIREKANLSLVCPSLFYFMMPPSMLSHSLYVYGPFIQEFLMH